MLRNYLERLNPAHPIIDSTLAAGDHVWNQTLALKRLVIRVLRTIAKCWSFFKDIHFSWYVIIPAISSMPALDNTLALVLWCLLFLPLLAAITFMALDSVFDLRADDEPHEGRRRTTAGGDPSSRATHNATPRLHSAPTGYYSARTDSTPSRRHRALKPLRSRRPELW